MGFIAFFFIKTLSDGFDLYRATRCKMRVGIGRKVDTALEAALTVGCRSRARTLWHAFRTATAAVPGAGAVRSPALSDRLRPPDRSEECVTESGIDANWDIEDRMRCYCELSLLLAVYSDSIVRPTIIFSVKI